MTADQQLALADAAAMLRLPPCVVCGAPSMAIAPGSDDERLGGDGFLIARGEAARGWCGEHWPAVVVRDAA